MEQPEKEAEPESEAEVVKEELRELLTVKLPERLLDTETVLEPLLREEAEGDRVPLMLPEYVESSARLKTSRPLFTRLVARPPVKPP